MNVSLDSILNALETRVGLPRPDWTIIFEWVSANIEDGDLNNAWTQLAADWTDHLIDALPSGYCRTESSNFMLLSKANSQTVDRLLRCCERSRDVVLETLVGVARDEGYGKHVVLAFDDVETYYDYIADFHPEEGEFAPSGGIFLDEGYGHFALCTAANGEHDRTIAHELNHALLRHLPLPLWLNEGVTQVMEDLVVGSSRFTIDREMVRRHRHYWNPETIHSFWSGDSFVFPDDGQELSYHLAQVLLRNLMSDYPKRVPEFLNAANYGDAGNSALNSVCGISLGARVTQFLGAGEWEPRTNYFEESAEEANA